jgi:hypothetical protein
MSEEIATRLRAVVQIHIVFVEAKLGQECVAKLGGLVDFQ